MIMELIELVKRIQIIKLHRPKKTIDPSDETAYVIQEGTVDEGGMLQKVGVMNKGKEQCVRGSFLPELALLLIAFFG